jgi:hypothetical protein
MDCRTSPDAREKPFCFWLERWMTKSFGKAAGIWKTKMPEPFASKNKFYKFTPYINRYEIESHVKTNC